MKIQTEILVIGSGIAGLWFALNASKYANITIVTKKHKAESNTNYAQGGIASVISGTDKFEYHIQDTLNCGGGICHIDAVYDIVNKGPDLINKLIKEGVKFSRKGQELDLGMEGGHTKKRIVHAHDLTGKEIENKILLQLSKRKNVKILEHHTAIELITEHQINNKINPDNIHCFGAYVYNEEDKNYLTIISKLTVLCTGGIGQIYLHTTNPSIATGDGIAMAYRSGAVIGDMEFVQFHPTSLFEQNPSNKDQSFLISEAVRGAGGILKTMDGKEFMQKYDKRGSLAPRDIVARAIDNELKRRGETFVYLDVSSISRVEFIEKFPNIYEKCNSIGIKVPEEMIPVVPAAHYICGGIKTDLNGKTSIKNLYALGECAMTGLHGANRLASNSLLEAVVISDNSAVECAKQILKVKPINKNKVPSWDDSGTENAEEWILIEEDRNEIKSIMSNYVGIVRTNLRLKRAKSRITLIKNEIERFYKKTRITRELIELRNIALISYLVIRSALIRKESRGLHYNTDYPTSENKYKKDTLISIY